MNKFLLDETSSENTNTENTNTENTETAVKKVEESVTTSYPKQYSKIVYLRRVPNMGGLPGQDPADTKDKIGSGFKGNSVLRGLTFDEEKIYLPQIIGTDSKSPNWEKETKDYWSNISKDVPYSENGKGGVELEVGFIYNNHEDYIYDTTKCLKDVNGTLINHKGVPINLADYILWRYCLVYSRVANVPEDIGKSPKIGFYLFSKDKEIADKKSVIVNKRKALQLLFSRTNDREWVDYVLRVMIAGDKSTTTTILELSKMAEDEKDILLQDYVEAMPDRFMVIANDTNLQMKSFIEVCIAMNKLTRIPNTDTITLDGTTLGNSITEVVGFLNNPKNSSTLQMLKAQVRLT